MRKAISKRLRFEVFKRDGFRCVYCGASPVTEPLHVCRAPSISRWIARYEDLDEAMQITSRKWCSVGMEYDPRLATSQAKYFHGVLRAWRADQ